MDHDFSVGRWVAKPSFTGSRFLPEIGKIARQTDKLLYVSTPSWGIRLRQFEKSKVLATFGTQELAEDFCQKAAGIRGELNRREIAARKAADEALDKLIASLAA